MSYNTEGIICFDELVDLLAAVGKVELFSNEYITFRGGRQSINRRTHNAELLLLCTRRKKSDPASRERIDRFKDETKCKNLLRGGFHPGRIRRAFTVIDDRVSFLGEGGPYLQTDCLVYFHTPVPSGLLAPLTSAELAGIRHSLEICMFNDRKEECDVLLELLRNGIPGEMTVKIAKKLLQALKKLLIKNTGGTTKKFSKIPGGWPGKRLTIFGIFRQNWTGWKRLRACGLTDNSIQKRRGRRRDQ